jgi:putative oxidoreductase
VLACGPGVFSIDELIARRLEPDMEFSAELNEGFSKSGVLEEAVAGR